MAAGKQGGQPSRGGADDGVRDDPGPLEEVYDELRELARRYLSRERRDHTLQPTALVHEAYLRMIKRKVDGLDRAHFFWTAARAMRSVLVDHARRHLAAKRGGAGHRVALDDAVASYEERAVDLISLDDALEQLAKVDQRLTRVIDLRFFGGLTDEEAAAALGLSSRTIRREWRFARAWLHNRLGKGEPHDA